MKIRIALLCASAACGSPSIAADPQPFAPAPLQLEVPRQPAAIVDHPVFVESTLSAEQRQLLKELKPGMTRKQVEAHFTADAGLIDLTAERYYLTGATLPSHQVVMLAISFKPAAMDEAAYADVQRRMEWFRAHGGDPRAPTDVVKEAGAPFASHISID